MNEIIAKGITIAQDLLARLDSRATKAQQGQSLVEYALILAFIALLVIVAMKALQPAISNTFNHTTNCLNSAGTPTPTAGTGPC